MRDEESLWELGRKRLQEDGDSVLWETLGSIGVAIQLLKILRAVYRGKTNVGTLKKSATYTLDDYIVPAAVIVTQLIFASFAVCCFVLEPVKQPRMHTILSMKQASARNGSKAGTRSTP